MSDGTFSIRRRQPKAMENRAVSAPAAQKDTYEFFLGAGTGNIGEGAVKGKGKTKSKPVGDADEFRVEATRKKRLRRYDKLLKAFKYSAALDSVLEKVIFNYTKNENDTQFDYCDIVDSPDHKILAYSRVNSSRRSQSCFERQRRRSPGTRPPSLSSARFGSAIRGDGM